MTQSQSLKLRYYPDSILLVKTIPCPNDKRFREHIVSGMSKVMIEHNGIGLAAPQVALSYSVFIMLDPEDPSKTISFYNPEILYHSDDSEWGTEGCLSLLGLTTQVLRFKWIELAFEDSEGISHRWKMYGQSARCAQHEIDHLNGILIFDHIQSKLRRLIFLEKCRKARKKYDRLR